jgi:hypothetical protein
MTLPKIGAPVENSVPCRRRSGTRRRNSYVDFRGYKLIYRAGNANNDLRNERMYAGWNWDDEISSVWG